MRIGDEIFVQIEGHPNYYVSENGNVLSMTKGMPHILKPVNRQGYLEVQLNKKCYGVHRLVARAFIPNPENKAQVNHIDYVRNNNHVSNLEWVTKYENIMYSMHRMHRWRKDGHFNENPPRLGTGKKVRNRLTGEIYKDAKEAATVLGVGIRTVRHKIYGQKGMRKILEYIDK